MTTITITTTMTMTATTITYDNDNDSDNDNDNKTRRIIITTPIINIITLCISGKTVGTLKNVLGISEKTVGTFKDHGHQAWAKTLAPKNIVHLWQHRWNQKSVGNL